MDLSQLVKQDVDLSQDGGPSLIITCAVLLPLTWIAVGLRTYTRVVLTKTFQIDDWFMVIAQFLFTTTCAMIIEGTRRGLGKHNAAVTNPDDLVAALMWQSIATIFYVLNMIFIKLSIGVFLLRLAVWTSYKWILWISLIAFTLWGTGIFIWNIFQCTPVAKQWDFRIERGHCASPDAIISSAYALSALTVISDWLYALLPVPMVWSVKMTKQAKWTVVAILGLGIFASVATLIRLAFLNKLQEAEDLLYSAVDAMIWTIVEPGVAIFASSLATIRPLLRIFHIRGFGSRSNTRTLSSDDSTAGIKPKEKKKKSKKSASATSGVGNMSLDNLDDESDFRTTDTLDEKADVALESKGRPRRKRPNDGQGGDTLSEILAMDDEADMSESSGDDDSDDSDGDGGGYRSRPDDLEAQRSNKEGPPERKRPVGTKKSGLADDTLSEILAMDENASIDGDEDAHSTEHTADKSGNAETQKSKPEGSEQKSKSNDAGHHTKPENSESHKPDEEKGPPERKRPVGTKKDGLGGDTLSEILAMDDGL